LLSGSVRLRLTTWYCLTLAVLVAAVSLFWYLSLSSNLLLHLDEGLQEAARAAELGHVYEQQILVPEQACAILEVYSYSQDWPAAVQLRAPNGDIACRIPGKLEIDLPFSVEARRQVHNGLPCLESQNVGNSKVRILTEPVERDGRLAWIIQVGKPLDEINHTLYEQRIMALFFTPLAILVLSVSGWLMAGRVLAPVIRITDTAERITAEKLSSRLPESPRDDEFNRLTRTINSMLARLEESFRRIRQFSGDASHELRTPLAIIKGETEVALRWAKNDEELRQTLESNLEEINIMERIVSDLLSLARSDSGEMRLDIAEFSLSDLLQDIYMHTRTLAERVRHTVRLHLLVDEEIHMCGDQIQIYRALLNVVNNSVKYTPDGGEIDITLQLRQNNRALITVSDSGVGIAEEHLTHIFDRFYRVDESRNRDHGGTGLGLAIVKAIVTAHQGDITVTSTPGSGTTFAITLPLRGPQNDSP